ncbi:MAG TPA: tetratricopeptide repeat protein [Edaphocola sp.]|nr:tetratricopeptide repeat protein [Edaphocola sp.]
MYTRNILTTLLICILPLISLKAQPSLTSPELLQSIKEATEATNRGDYNNAIALYNYAIRLSPDNVPLRRDLAYCYFLKKDYDNANEVLKPILNSESADPQTYQLAAGIEQAKGKKSKAKNILNSGLKKFPSSGLLYNAKGNVLIVGAKKSNAAIKEWEKGILVEPNYPANYFNIARTLSQEGNYLWTIIYAEKYINLDNQGQKAVDMRKLLLDAYKNIFTTHQSITLPKFKQKAERQQELSFEQSVLDGLLTNISTVSDGYTTDNISMLRTRFLIYWNNHFAQKFPESIFSYQTQILKEGYYNAYNQSIFGAVSDSQEFSIWLNQFKEDFQKFEIWKEKNKYIPSYSDQNIKM